MEFKARSKAIQVLRLNRSDDDDADAAFEALGTVKGPTFAPDAALRAKLTEEELREVLAHAERRNRAERFAREHAVYSLPDTLRQVTDWLRLAEADEAVTFAEEVRVPISRLRRMLARIGLTGSHD